MVLELLTLLIVFAVLGFAVWLVITYVPMPEPFKKALVVLVVLLLLLWIVRYVFASGGLLSLR